MVIFPEQHYFMDTEDGEDVGQWRLAICTGGLYMVGRGVKNESYRFVCAVVVFYGLGLSRYGTPKIVQKSKF